MGHERFVDPNELTSKFKEKLKLNQFPHVDLMLRFYFIFPSQDTCIHRFGKFLIIFLLCFLTFSTGFYINVSSVAECLIQITMLLCFLIIYIHLMANTDKIIDIMLTIVQTYESNGTSQQQILSEIVVAAFEISKYPAVMFLPFVGCYAVSPVVIPNFLTWISPQNQTFQKSLPLKLECFVDETEYFYYIFAFQFIIAYFVCFFPLLFLYFECIIIGMIFGQLRCLRYRLQELDIEHDSSLVMVKIPPNDLIFMKMKEIVYQHKICIKLHEHLCSIGNLVFFSSIVVVVFNFVLDGTAMVILFDSDMYGAARMLVAYCCAIICLMCICIPSQIIINASYDFFIQSYCVNWYNYRPSIRINLLFLMMRAMKILRTRAGPIFEMNFESFSKVMKRSVSFITAFRSLYVAYQEKNGV